MEAEETMECLQEFPEHHKMILDRLNEQREQDRFTDITLIVDGEWSSGTEESEFVASVLISLSPTRLFYPPSVGPLSKVNGESALGPVVTCQCQLT